MKRALVTGNRGFVGRHMHAALLERGFLVDGVDIADPHRPCDARDFFRTNNTRYDLVVHLAAIVGGRATIEGEPLKVAVDLAIDAECFGWAMRTRPAHLVYYSSSAAYPTGLQTRDHHRTLAEADIDLGDVRTPDLTYGWSKLTGEQLARHAAPAGLAVHVLRPFSGYGEDQALDYPFPSFIARAARHDDPFEVWGDGEQVRDFIHIDDVIAATLAVVDQDVREPVNLGWGRPTSFNQLAAMCQAAAGYTAPLKHLPAAPTGVHWRVADTTVMRQVYTPRITLEEGIERALRAA